MARPTEEVVLWAAQDVTLPALAGPNKVLPISDLINKGWDMNQKPAADEFNYLLNNYAKWLVYLDEKSGGASPDAPEVDSLPSTTPLRDPDGKGCFKGIKASNTTNANSFNMIDTYNSKTAVSVSVSGNEIGNFVYNGLLVSGDGKSGLACNTAGTHYGSVTGNVTGNVTGIHYGNVIGDVTGAVTGNTAGTHYGSVVGDVTGNADTASKWQTPRTLTLAGSVSGSAYMDGSGNVTLNTHIQSSGVSILTGVIAHGGTIPLPSGYTQAQCKWTVSPNLLEDANMDGILCESDANRLVTMRGVTITGIANYLIIGVK